MIDIKTLTEHPEIAANIRLEVSGSDLKTFAEEIHAAATGAALKTKPSPRETYLTPEETSKLLKVSLVTLWTWGKKGILPAYRLGSAKRYKLSDVERMLTKE